MHRTRNGRLTMRLTLYTDYSLRVLLYLGLHPGRLCSIAEIARGYKISESHLTKVVHALGKQAVIETLRGRGGWIRLARPPEAIRLGEVVRQTEGGLQSPDCASCPLSPGCVLTGVLHKAMRAFFAVFDDYTVADLIVPERGLQALLHQPAAETDEGEAVCAPALALAPQ